MTVGARRYVRALSLACMLLSSRAAAQSLLTDPRGEFEQALAEFDQAQEIQADKPDGARRLFRSAAGRLENIAAAGVVNGQLEYNLGNCYLQAGDVGRAILHYRRAQRLTPGDPLLSENLRAARSRCLTSIRPTRRSALFRAVFFLHYDTSVADRARAAIVLYVAVWVWLALRNFIWRRGVTVSAIVCVVIALSLAVSVAMDRWSDRNAPAGVITAMDVAAYKGPGTGYQRQFEQPLQPGVEFTLQGRRSGWWNIELPDGKSGWIGADNAELIPHGHL